MKQGAVIFAAAILSCVVALAGTARAEASVAAGPVGAEVGAATTSTERNDDIYAFGTSEGLFIGLSLEGTLLIPDQDANMAYYGEAVTTREVIQTGEVSNEDADTLCLILKGE